MSSLKRRISHGRPVGMVMVTFGKPYAILLM